MLDLCRCTQSVSRAPGAIPGLGQPLLSCPRPLIQNSSELWPEEDPDLTVYENSKTVKFWTLKTFSKVKTTPLIYDTYCMYLSHRRIQSHSPECLQMNSCRQWSFNCLISGQRGVRWTDYWYCQTTNQPCSSDIIISWENVQHRFAGCGTFLADKTLFSLLCTCNWVVLGTTLSLSHIVTTCHTSVTKMWH